MGKESFLLLFVVGAGAIAAWIALRLPKLAPSSFRGGTAHLLATLVVGLLLGPAVRAVPGLPSTPSIMAALFLLERRGRVVVGSPCSGHGFKFAPVIGQRLAALALEALE